MKNKHPTVALPTNAVTVSFCLILPTKSVFYNFLNKQNASASGSGSGTIRNTTIGATGGDDEMNIDLTGSSTSQEPSTSQGPSTSKKPSTSLQSSTLQMLASTGKSTQQKMSVYLQQKITHKTKADIDNKLLQLFISDFQPFQIVEDNGFKQFVAALSPSYQFPSRFTISKTLILALYEDCLVIKTARQFWIVGHLKLLLVL